MGIKPGDPCMVIGSEVAEFTDIWLALCFIAQSHIYPGFTGKVATLTLFPLKWSCEDYSFLVQTVEDFEQGLDSIIFNSVNTPGLDASLKGFSSFISYAVVWVTRVSTKKLTNNAGRNGLDGVLRRV